MSKKITSDEFIKRAKEIHGDKYDYSKTVYTSALNNVTITCPIHGDFKQLPSNHLRGSGCKKCGTESIKRTTEWFITNAKKIHGDKYDYSKSIYVNGHTKIEIICSKHGSFWQIPNDHLYGHGCHFCSNEKNGNIRNKGLEFYLNKAKEIHGNKYDYSKVEYVNAKTNVCIICPIHGEFWQSMYHHAQGKGCPRCSRKIKSCTEEFIEKAKQIHGDKYDYSKVEYINSHTKVCIICPIHGEFMQTPYNHLKGKGCVHCKGYNTELFIKEAKAVHGDKYDYSKVEYVNNAHKVRIICPKHGEFFQRASSHLSGRGCPSCGQVLSKSEEELYSIYVKKIGQDNVERKNRKILNGKEIDIFFPKNNFGIEFDGLLWHSEKYRNDKSYHLNKTIECEKNGITLIHIFEDEWLNKKNVIIDKIDNFLKLNYSKEKIPARKCRIVEGNFESSRKILNENHIQGEAKSSVYLNCLYGDKIVGAMLFTLRGENKWELVRWVTDNNLILQGLASKTLKYFIEKYDPIEIKSFLDRRYYMGDRNLYTILGFKFDGYVNPDYKYTKNGSNRIHKFNFRKQILSKKYNLPLTLTEKEMTKQLGFYRIYDCGLIRYLWRKNE